VLFISDSGQTRQMSRQDEISRDGRLSSSSRLAPAVPAAYLAKLNAEQRRAVEHGGESLDEAPPLLIIAGAGSGKTNALAHRVAHLIVGGVDPRRIMLLTFSAGQHRKCSGGLSGLRRKCLARSPA
jgi:primosomal protein N'